MHASFLCAACVLLDLDKRPRHAWALSTKSLLLVAGLLLVSHTASFCAGPCLPSALLASCSLLGLHPTDRYGPISVLVQVEAGAAALRERWAQPSLPSGFWANNPGLHQGHTTAVAGAAAGRGSADYARLIEALKTDALGEGGGPGGK